jgi:hypothetical protein
MIPTSPHPLATGRRFMAAACAVFTILGSLGRAATASEPEIRALFLFHFAGFVEWPPTAFSDEHSPLVIGIVGEDPFGRDLDDALAGQAVHGRRLVIRRFPRTSGITFCHVLFISRSADDKLDEILAHVQGLPVLTVGESEEFAQRGGMIRFLSVNHKTRFCINVAAAKNAALVISSKLLRVADLVGTTKGKS